MTATLEPPTMDRPMRRPAADSPATPRKSRTMKFSFASGSSPLPGYTVRRAISRGAFGEVYYALSDSGRETALKLLQNNLDVELRGVRQCLNLSHPNLVTLFDVRQDAEGDYWLVMEYVPGGSLAEAVAAHPEGMPEDLALHWIEGIAAATAYLHSRGIVHRDLKPGNVLMDTATGTGTAGVVKVGDVGLSKFITASRRSANTQSVGTVYYMAPEVANGRYGPEIDQYALGVMAYEVLTGRVPFDGETTGEILLKHLSSTPDLSALSDTVRPVVEKSLAKTPEERYADVAAFSAAFREALTGEAAPARPVVASVEPPPPPLDSGGPRGIPQSLDEVKAEAAKLKDPDVRRAIGKTVAADLRSATELTAGWPGWAKVVAVVLGVSLLVGALQGEEEPLRVIVVVSCGYACLRLYRYFTDGAVVSPAGDDAAPVRETAVPQRQFEATYIQPAELKPTGRMLAGSAALVPLFAIAATAAVALIDADTLGRNEEAIGTFAVSSILGAWAILGTRKWLGGASDLTRRNSRLLSGLCGVVVGLFTATAVGLVDASLPAVDHREVITDHIGGTDLTIDNVPTPAGMAVFFAGLFGLRNWTRQTDPLRSRRVRVASVLMSAFVALVVSRVFAFPAAWAVLWAATTSVAVQAVSPWVSRRERMQLNSFAGERGWV